MDKRTWAPAIALLAAGQVEAASWTIMPSVTASATYVDNVALAPPGSEEDDIIVQVIPGVAVRGEGGRVRLNLDYRAQAIHYDNNDRSDEIAHQFLGDATIDLVKELLALDLGGTYTQRAVDPGDAIDPENIALGDGTTDVSTYSVSPVLNTRVGEIARFAARYTYGRVHYGGGSLSDVTHHVGAVALTSEAPPDALWWGLTLNHTTNEPDDGTNAEFNRARLDLAYPVQPRFALLAGIGYESNSYSLTGPSSELEGEEWSVGFRWLPSLRSSIEASYGERPFGETMAVAATHRTRSTNWSVRYAEELTTASLLDTRGLPFDEQGNVIFPIEGPRVTTEVFVNRSLVIAVDGDLAKTDWNLAARRHRRDSQLGSADDTLTGFAGGLSWRFAPLTTGHASFDRFRREFGSPAREDDYLILSLGVERELGRSLVGEVRYGYLERDSTAAGEDYTRNLVMASIRADF